MRPIAGADFPRSEEMKLQGMHDAQRFIVGASQECVINTDVRVKWRGHDADEEMAGDRSSK